MPRHPVSLVVLICACVSVTFTSGHEFRKASDLIGFPANIRRSNLTDGFDDEIQMYEKTLERAGKAEAKPDNREIRSSSIWTRILDRIGKTRETFSGSSRYPPQRRETKPTRRFYSPAAMWSKFKRNKGKPTFAQERAMNDGKFQAMGKRRAGQLSINGALSSLADMLLSEGQRRDKVAAMRLRHRLLVAGK